MGFSCVVFEAWPPIPGESRFLFSDTVQNEAIFSISRSVEIIEEFGIGHNR